MARHASAADCERHLRVLARHEVNPNLDDMVDMVNRFEEQLYLKGSDHWGAWTAYISGHGGDADTAVQAVAFALAEYLQEHIEGTYPAEERVDHPWLREIGLYEERRMWKLRGVYDGVSDNDLLAEQDEAFGWRDWQTVELISDELGRRRAERRVAGLRPLDA